MLNRRQFTAQVAEKMGTGIREETPQASAQMEVSVPVEDLMQAIEILRQDFDATFADLFAREGVKSPDGVQLHLIFGVASLQRWVHLRVQLTREHPTFPSLTTLFPAACWYERAIWEELGVLPDGHTGLRGLRLPAHWPPGIFPHRLPFAWAHARPLADPRYFTLDQASSGVVDYPLGPVRSGVVESGHYLLRTVGEELIDIHLQLFYKHRGVEKRGEGLALQHAPLLAERISGTSAVAHALALCQALEHIADIDIPRRARFLRTLFAELERLYNHLGYQADLCQATGLAVAQAQFEILKERLLRLNAQVSGHRYLFGLVVPGGVSRDVSPEMQQTIQAVVYDVQREFTRLRRLLLASPSHLDRLEGTGKLTPRDALDYGAVGPIGRASGVNRDVRRDHPYAAYAELDFEVPVLHEGDAFARARLRLEETTQACRLIEQVLANLPEGEVRVALPDLPVGKSALGWSESTHGESLHWVQIGEDGTLARYHVRPGSFANWQAFPLCVPGHNILTDFPIIEQSFGLSFAGADC